MSDDNVVTTESIKRRPEYIERLEKALLAEYLALKQMELHRGLLQDPTCL